MLFIVAQFVLLSTSLAVSASLSTSDVLVPSLFYQFDIPAWQSFNSTCSSALEPYIVRPSAGKGLGVFATRPLQPGDIISEEVPVLKVTPPRFQEGIGYPIKEMGLIIREAFDTLPETLQSEVLSLHAHTTPAERQSADFDELVPIIRSNGYTTANQISLLPKISRINHSCRPNAGYYWNERLNKQVVYATRPIKEDEEIFVSYIPLLHNHAHRQKRLDQYGFKCGCDACTVADEESETSDRRRDTLRQMFINLERQLTLEAPSSIAATKRSHSMIAESLKLVQLLEEEGLADYYARAYRITAISHARLGYWEQATLWANKSYQLRLIADPQSSESKEMEILTGQFISNWNDDLRNKSMRKTEIP